jgi:hypothetical protein
MRIALLGSPSMSNRYPRRRTQRIPIRVLCRRGGGEGCPHASPKALGEMPGFVADMDAAGPWEPHGILLAMAEPNGPVEHAVFARMMALWRSGLEALRGRVEGVYCVLHGAGLTTEHDDPEGTLQALAREVLGPEVPLVCSYDLHANVSDAMVRDCDAFIGYRTNPHLDMRERGAESAQLMRRLLAGTRAFRAHRRLPIVPPPSPCSRRKVPMRGDRSRPGLGGGGSAHHQRFGHGGLRLWRHAVHGIATVVTATDQAGRRGPGHPPRGRHLGTAGPLRGPGSRR